MTRGKIITMGGIILLSMGLVACSEKTRDPITFDTSMFDVCLAVAENPNDPMLQQQLANASIVKKLRINFGDNFVPDYQAIAERKERILAYKAALKDYESNLAGYAALGSEFLPEGSMPVGLGINLVCGTPSDGYGFVVDGKKELFIDVTNVTHDFFPHLMVHELWHMAFNAAYPEVRIKHSLADNKAPAMKYLAFQFLNEGVGHYYSIRRRLEPEIVYDNWSERTSKIFAMLHENTAKLSELTDKQSQQDLIRTGHMSVPFWQKWIAVSGAVVTYRLKQTLGVRAVSELVSGGPCAFISRYNSETEKHPSWEKIPKEIEQASCA